jgi:hypothetical protein
LAHGPTMVFRWGVCSLEGVLFCSWHIFLSVK